MKKNKFVEENLYCIEKKLDNINYIFLGNKHIEIIILNELGGKIFKIINKKNNHNYLWENNIIKPSLYKNNDYDNQWSGGIDEMFPNDAKIEHNGLNYTDHGFLWNCFYNYSFQINDNCATLNLFATTQNKIIEVIKTIVIYTDRKDFLYKVSIKNISDKNIDYLYKIHSAFFINKYTKININGNNTFCEPEFNFPKPSKNLYTWDKMPLQNGQFKNISDFSNYNDCDLIFQTVELNEGFFEIQQKDIGSKVRFDFDKKIFPYITLFICYGGFNNYHVAVVEPSTTFTSDFLFEKEKSRVKSLSTNENFYYETKILID